MHYFSFLSKAPVSSECLTPSNYHFYRFFLTVFFLSFFSVYLARDSQGEYHAVKFMKRNDATKTEYKAIEVMHAFDMKPL